MIDSNAMTGHRPPGIAFRRLGLIFAIGLLLSPELLRLSRTPRRQKLSIIDKSGCEQYAVPEIRPPSLFTDISDQVKLDFQHAVGPLGTYYMPEINGTGGALFDFDNDGDLDIYLVNAGRSPRAQGDFPPGTRTENRLFRQEEGGALTDVTAESGLGDQGYGYGCAIGDVDNDGDFDVYITNVGPDRLYLNRGDGTFADATQEAGIADNSWGMSAVFFDYDRDGWLDLAVSNYLQDRIHGFSVACGYPDGRVSYCGPLKFEPERTRLYHNEGPQAGGDRGGGIRFRDVTESAGLSAASGAGMGMICADFTRDGWPDIFVANDEMPNRLWVNQHDGTFREEGIARGVAFNGEGKVQASMGTAVGDFDRDGDFDLVATHLMSEHTTLYLNQSGGYFTDGSKAARLVDATWQHTGWGVAFLDLDHDGDLDLPLVNGLVVPCDLMFAPHGEELFQVVRQQIRSPADYWLPYADANKLLMNGGDGTFEDRSVHGGDFCGALGSARALLNGDIDNDGDEDLLVTYCGQRARLYRNDVPKSGSWLKVRAIDPRYRRDAYGAEVTVVVDSREYLRLVQPSTGYLSSQDVRVHVGLGRCRRYDALRVRWPDGLREAFPGGDVDRQVEVRRGEGKTVEEAGTAAECRSG